MRLPPLLAFLFLLLPAAANAWWDAAWTQRTRVVLDTGAQGVPTSEAVSALPVALRLHSGNFDFIAAHPEGRDLRVVAGDDKTPLSFRIERWDSVNELALVWVLLPTVAPASDKNLLYVYAGNEQAPATEPAPGGGFDTATRLALHFSDAAEGPVAPSPFVAEPNGLLGGALRLAGSAVTLPANAATATAADGALTLSMWLKTDGVDRGTALQQGPLQLALQGGQVIARIGSAVLQGGALKPATWTHVALTLGQGRAALYVDGAAVAQGTAATPALAGDIRLGDGINGALDELQLAASVRSPAWVALSAATQGIGARGLKTTPETSDAAAGSGGESAGYIGILVKNLTIDAWVVIVILGLMMVVAVWVMVAKALQVQRADKANRSFLMRFREAREDLLALGGDTRHAQSSLFRLYSAGLRELDKREIGRSTSASLSDASLNAVKASIDADLVRETHRLNAQMVLLTIAISGGPFLGLLGTVVGVMITFAAIAAAGDVNVNAIAPGIAAALLATVAGLAVAIPALFGYNYLASRIRNISADMQIFVDEFITRVAEKYGAGLMQLQAENQPYDDINITPMLDLAYVLLVTFIILTTASAQGVKVQAPRTEAANSLAKPQTRAITITADGALYLDAYPVTLEQLSASLAQYKAANPALPVVLKGDARAQYRLVMEVLEVAKKLDITEIGLVTQRVAP